jgi:hypothetical protein
MTGYTQLVNGHLRVRDAAAAGHPEKFADELGQLSSWLSYNPYLPAMALFGMPTRSCFRSA